MFYELGFLIHLVWCYFWKYNAPFKKLLISWENKLGTSYKRNWGHYKNVFNWQNLFWTTEILVTLMLNLILSSIIWSYILWCSSNMFYNERKITPRPAFQWTNIGDWSMHWVIEALKSYYLSLCLIRNPIILLNLWLQWDMLQVALARITSLEEEIVEWEWIGDVE